jgi:simple sugar transport system permease protein
MPSPPLNAHTTPAFKRPAVGGSWLQTTAQIGVSLLVVMLFTTLVLWMAGAPPLAAYGAIFKGSLGSWTKLSHVIKAWIPLTLCACGLLYTFRIGLWNIGVEGQIIVGAIFASWAARTVPGPGWFVIAVGIVAGLIGGAIWGLLAGVLKTHGGVNEIFGGLGLYFVGLGMTTYLVIGPWAREGVASTSGTDLFDEDVWFPTIGSLDISWLSLVLAVVSVVGVYFLMRGTLFGLKLKAIGSNMESSARLGVSSNRYMLSAFALAGALAGLAGTTQAMAFHHKLVPSISGGYGFLGILVVLLAGFRAAPVAPLALFFAALSVGSLQLELRLDLDSSVGGVIQGTLVLFVLLATGWQRRRLQLRAAADVEGSG